MKFPLLCRVLAGAVLLVGMCGTAQGAGEDCRYVQVAKVPLRYLGDGLQITVEGSINGKPANMLVDTGAYGILLTRTGTERHDLDLHLTRKTAEGVGGESRIYQAKLDAFAIGPGKPAQGWVDVLGDTGDRPAYEAIAGAPFLLQMDMEIALADKQLTFFKAEDCRNAFLAYWDRRAMVIPFRRAYGSPNPHFTVEVNGERLDAIIDTGADTSAITARMARKIGVSDRPDPKRLSQVGGTGTKLATSWRAHTRSIKIGDEVVLDADIDVIDPQGYTGFDIVLGADFLRAHRVLFAMSQDKLYVSYVGGDVFAQRATIEPWMRKEAEGGNPDAQLVLAAYYQAGRGVPRDPAQAQLWIDKAAALGHVKANLMDGARLLQAGRYADAAQRLDAALAKLDDGRYEALDLYRARIGSGQQALGAQELAQRFGRYDRTAWPGPIADFYLGRLDDTGLRRQADAEPQFARDRGCEVTEYLAGLARAQGRAAQADALQDDWNRACSAR